MLIKSKVTNTSKARHALKFQQFKDYSHSSNLMLIQQLHLQEGQKAHRPDRNRDLRGIREPNEAAESGRTTRRQQSCSPNQEPSAHIEVIATLRPQTDSKEVQVPHPATTSPEKQQAARILQKPKKVSPQMRLMATSRNKLLQSHFRTCKEANPESPSMMVVESKQKQITQPPHKQAGNMSKHLHKILGMQAAGQAAGQRPKVSIVTNLPPADDPEIKVEVRPK